MADITQQGPQSTRRTNQTELGQGHGSDLSELSVTPSVMEVEGARITAHTSESIQTKWGARSFDTGVIIRGRVLGRAA
jgi:hypothetical protein